ncbi:hypothetical protein GQ457_07G044640 [Hibiscus cannabinus]
MSAASRMLVESRQGPMREGGYGGPPEGGVKDSSFFLIFTEKTETRDVVPKDPESFVERFLALFFVSLRWKRRDSDSKKRCLIC